jgi:hypothetical protein
MTGTGAKIKKNNLTGSKLRELQLTPTKRNQNAQVTHNDQLIPTFANASMYILLSFF